MGLGVERLGGVLLSGWLAVGGGVVGLLGPAPTAAAQQRPATSTKLPGSYIEIPLKGTFGEDFTAAGVYDALKTAKQMQRVTHVIFTIDSPGGVVADANAIAAAMDEFDAEFTYSCVITAKAYSASIWVMCRCRNIFFVDGAASGAAVAFSRDESSGAAEVDAKFNSAIASGIAAAAEKKGHPGLLFQAMILPELEVFMVTDEDGKRTFLRNEPSKDKNYEVLDRRGQVLSLTTNDAVRIGLARRLSRLDLKLIGDVLGVDDWKLHDNSGQDAMKRAKSRAEQYKRELETLDKKLVKIDEDLKKSVTRLQSSLRSAQNTERQSLSASLPYWRDVKSHLLSIDTDEAEATRVLKRQRQVSLDWYKYRRLDPIPKIPEIKPVDLGIDKDQIWRAADNRLR